MHWNISNGPKMYGDPASVRAAGRRALAQAERLHEEADLTASLAEVGWVSAGADRWRHDLEATVQGVRDDAARVEDLAEALFAHADAAEATLAAITSAMEAFERRVADARDTVATAVDSAVDGARDAAVSTAQGILDAARSAPPALSLDWLDFRR